MVDRVSECLFLRRNWVPPPPPPQVWLPPPGPKWEGDTLACGGGGGGNSDEGTDTLVLYDTIIPLRCQLLVTGEIDTAAMINVGRLGTGDLLTECGAVLVIYP